MLFFKRDGALESGLTGEFLPCRTVTVVIHDLVRKFISLAVAVTVDVPRFMTAMPF